MSVRGGGFGKKDWSTFLDFVGISQKNHLMGEWVREAFGEDRGIVGGEDIDR